MLNLYFFFSFFLLCSGDCSMYVILFAHSLMFDSPCDFFDGKPIEFYRKKIAIHLYNHAIRKLEKNYTSDPEVPPRRKKKVVDPNNMIVYVKRKK